MFSSSIKLPKIERPMLIKCMSAKMIKKNKKKAKKEKTKKRKQFDEKAKKYLKFVSKKYIYQVYFLATKRRRVCL